MAAHRASQAVLPLRQPDRLSLSPDILAVPRSAREAAHLRLKIKAATTAPGTGATRCPSLYVPLATNKDGSSVSRR